MKDRVIALVSAAAIVFSAMVCAVDWDPGTVPVHAAEPEETVQTTAPAVRGTPPPAEEFTPRKDVPMPARHQRILWNACKAGVPYEIMLGLIEVESGFDAFARNGDNWGYCQLSGKYFHAEKLSPTDNLVMGAETLRSFILRYDGDLTKGLTAYHAGHWTGNTRYAEKVMDRARHWGWSG